MIGRDEKMLVVFEWIRTAAKSDISVLVLGPTGSGKELVAKMIHELSRRSLAKFQAVNCAALPDTLFESEIFGYEKGAFTGAHDRKPGRLELANDGTLFLTKSATCRSSPRPSCCASSRSAGSNAWAATSPSPSTSA
jgi:transcriptional regulator with PAS, ATPase and Fis domain